MKEIKYLYHYYEKANGPLLNLSRLKISAAQEILDRFKKENKVFAAHRYDGYLKRRHELEKIILELFIKKNGKPRSEYPHYFVVEECKWLETWYIEPEYIRLPIDSISSDIVSFTYGDMFPIFSDLPNKHDDKEYRRQLYTYSEIQLIIEKYGLPQEWNPRGEFGPERYVEAHVWDENIMNSLQP